MRSLNNSFTSCSKIVHTSRPDTRYTECVGKGSRKPTPAAYRSLISLLPFLLVNRRKRPAFLPPWNAGLFPYGKEVCQKRFISYSKVVHILCTAMRYTDNAKEEPLSSKSTVWIHLFSPFLSFSTPFCPPQEGKGVRLCFPHRDGRFFYFVLCVGEAGRRETKPSQHVKSLFTHCPRPGGILEYVSKGSRKPGLTAYRSFISLFYPFLSNFM